MSVLSKEPIFGDKLSETSQDGNNRLTRMSHRRKEGDGKNMRKGGGVGRQKQMERLVCQLTHLQWKCFRKKKKYN